MSAVRRPPRKGPDRPFEPRAVVEGAGRALKGQAETPPDSFADGVEAHRVLKQMCPETEADCELGPYLPRSADAPEGSASLGGHTRTIRFPPFWHAWFSRQTAPRLATIDDLVDAQIERRVLRNFFRRLKHATIVAFVGSAAAAHWFSDQIAWLAERVPLLRAVWTLVTGSVR